MQIETYTPLYLRFLTNFWRSWNIVGLVLLLLSTAVIISSCNVEDETNDGQSNGNTTDYQNIIQSVSPLGGTVSLPNIGNVTFPFGAFRQSKSVTFKVTRDASYSRSKKTILVG